MKFAQDKGLASLVLYKRFKSTLMVEMRIRDTARKYVRHSKRTILIVPDSYIMKFRMPITKYATWIYTYLFSLRPINFDKNAESTTNSYGFLLESFVKEKTEQ